MAKQRVPPAAPPGVPDLPPALASCTPHYERVRLYLRRFLAFLKPWDAHGPGATASHEIASGPGDGAEIDDHVVRVLVGEGYADERAAPLLPLSDTLSGEPASGGGAADPGGRFERLRTGLGLSRWDVDLLWVLLLPELVPDFLWLYRAIWGDAGRLAAPEDFLLHVLDPFGGDQGEIRRALAPEGRLARLLLVEQIDVGYRTGGRNFRASGRLVEHLLGLDTLPRGPIPVLVVPATIPLAELAVETDLAKRLARLLASDLAATSRDPGAVPLYHFHGPEGVGRRTLCAVLAAEAGLGLVTLDLGAWATLDDLSPEALILARREAVLRGALLALHGAEALSKEEATPQRRALARFLADQTAPVFVLATDRCAPLSRMGHPVVPLGLRVPSHEQRERIWGRVLGELPARLAKDVDPRDLARKYNLSPARIRAAADEGAALARLRDAKGAVRHSDLVQATTAQLSHELTSVADRVERTMDWDDLILSDSCMEVLEEVLLRYEHSAQVMDVWGFRAKFAYGTGISVLFSGPPGTGKTMTAGILARELDMELFRVDLSRVVSKWIGETEKNLARVFDEAKASHAIILFDEADSLFGRRGEVRTSVDRYSNLEVNYLLQRMETYEGISILTTNQIRSMDEAFMRRITFKVSFPFPDAETRQRLWTSMIPSQAKVAKGIRFPELASAFDFTGGHIKNAVLRAAFLAAERGTGITHKLLVAAARDEARGMGRLLRVDGEDEDDEGAPAGKG